MAKKVADVLNPLTPTATLVAANNNGCNTVRPVYASTCNTGCGNVYTGGYAAGGCATAVAVTQLSRPVASGSYGGHVAVSGCGGCSVATSAGCGGCASSSCGSCQLLVELATPLAELATLHVARQGLWQMWQGLSLWFMRNLSLLDR